VVYQASAEALGCTWQDTTMVAAHSGDLAAAKQSGLHSAFIARPDEYGPGLGESKATTPVDFEALDLNHLADLLEC
jgi:2-haloacid dehalogenase